MGILDILFRGGKKKSADNVLESHESRLETSNLPIDEKFTVNFKENGGKFLYCTAIEEISANIQNIITENKWQEYPFFAMDKRLVRKFEKDNIKFSSSLKDSKIFITHCEHLIAQNGSILVCSNQLNEQKVNELPSNLIVLAKTSQLVPTIGEGLKTIKKTYGNQIPANITTLKHFKEASEDDTDFLTYGSSTKNLYLLLLEDL